MPEAEINPDGAVLVEGHHVGEFQGFRFTADQTADGEDAKAVKAAAQKALAAEFEARAERFSACANGDLALGSDGLLRWIGAPVATLAAGEDPLRPRVILLADEQLTGPARDKVFGRAERFVNFQIDTLLKPLVELKGAEHVTGIARGVAFRLAENFGLINRRDIAEDIKSLDQEGRAALRRLGVRFGAYHIFVPSLIKPAPAGLITLLWALANDGKDKPGLGDVVNALASGRTSVVVDPEFDRSFYKLAGFRPLGRRAVRVDILERLADLIRPALAWKPGTGARPDGAYDGSAFTVTPAMMSILGANAEDIEEILKGLGYRAEPKPAGEVRARLETLDQQSREAAEAAAAKAEAEKTANSAEEAEAVPPAEATGIPTDVPLSVDEVAASEAAPLEAATWTPRVEEAPAMEAPVSSPLEGEVSPPTTEAGASEVSAAEPGKEDAEAVESTPPEQTASGRPPLEGAGDAANAAAQASGPVVTDPEAEAEESKPILLWRQARFERPRHPRPEHRRRPARQSPGTDATPAQQATGERPGRDERRQGKPKFDRDRYKGPKGKPHGDGPRPDRQDRHAKDERKPSFQPRPREERPARVDPLSPFAKLAALRDQLKK